MIEFYRLRLRIEERSILIAYLTNTLLSLKVGLGFALAVTSTATTATSGLGHADNHIRRLTQPLFI